MLHRDDKYTQKINVKNSRKIDISPFQFTFDMKNVNFDITVIHKFNSGVISI